METVTDPDDKSADQEALADNQSNKGDKEPEGDKGDKEPEGDKKDKEPEKNWSLNAEYFSDWLYHKLYIDWFFTVHINLTIQLKFFSFLVFSFNPPI